MEAWPIPSSGIRAPLKPSQYISAIWYRGFQLRSLIVPFERPITKTQAYFFKPLPLGRVS